MSNPNTCTRVSSFDFSGRFFYPTSCSGEVLDFRWFYDSLSLSQPEKAKLTQPSKTDLERTVSFCQKNILCRWGSLMAGPGCKRHYLYTVGVIRAWKKKKQQRLSQRPSFWCETWPEEFLLSGKLGYDIAIEIPPIKTWYFPIGKGGFPYWKRLVWRKKPVFSRVNRVKFSGSNAESRRLNNGKCRECWWKIVWLRCFLSGRILGTCSNDSDCCFVVLLSFFLLASFLWLPKKCTRTKIHWRLG